MYETESIFLNHAVHRTTIQTIHRTTQKLGRVRAVLRLCGFYPGICLITEEKARKNLSQGSHTFLSSHHKFQVAMYKACPSESGTDKFMQRFI